MFLNLIDTPAGQVPVLTVGDTQIPQSGAMARYLARDLGNISRQLF